jgi:hypothetical protein
VLSDSPTTDEWRVLINFMQDWVDKIRTRTDTDDPHLHFEQASSVFAEADSSKQSLRPKAFDLQTDRGLESELKYLYVAITRARRNLWIFDQDEQKRAPFFELLRQCNLARLIKSSDLSKDSFATSSTAEEWKKSGDYFYKVSSCLLASFTLCSSLAIGSIASTRKQPSATRAVAVSDCASCPRPSTSTSKLLPKQGESRKRRYPWT